MMIGKIATTRMGRDRCKWMRQEMKASKMKKAKSGMKKRNHCKKVKSLTTMDQPTRCYIDPKLNGLVCRLTSC